MNFCFKRTTVQKRETGGQEGIEEIKLSTMITTITMAIRITVTTVTIITTIPIVITIIITIIKGIAMIVT